MTEEIIDGTAQTSIDEETLKKQHETLSKRLLEVFNEAQGELKGKISCAVKDPLVKRTIGKLKKLKGDKKLQQKDLQALNERFMSGHLPSVKAIPVCSDDSDDDDDDDDDDGEHEVELHATQKHPSYFSKIVQFQVYFVVASRNYAFKYVSRFGQSWLRSMIPTRQITTLATFLLYTYVLNAEVLLFFLPMFTLFISLLAMVISTIRSVRGEKRFREFKAWAELLKSVETALNIQEAEDNYFMNHLSPLISLPFAVILCVMSFAVSSQEVQPTSEMALLSLGLALTCFISFYDLFSLQALFTMAALVTATFLEGFNRSTDVSGLFGFSLGAVDGVQINFSLSIALRFVSLALAASLPFDKKYRTRFVGFMRSLVPCLYVLLWWEMFSLFFHQSSTTSLVRACVGAAALLFSIPAAFMLFCFTLVKWLISLQFLQVVGSALLLALPLLYLRFSQKSVTFVSKLELSSLGPSLKIVAGTSLVIFALSVVSLYRPAGLQVQESSLTWKDYNTLCHSQLGRNPVLSKRQCHQLKGHHVNWSGTVTNVRIDSIDNKFESVVNVFPCTIANWIACTYGKKYPEKDECTNAQNDLCGVARQSERACHLDAYNKYEFSIAVQQDSDGEEPGKVTLLASNNFQECIFHIRSGMNITFRGVLNSDAGSVDVNKIRVLDHNVPVKCIKNVYLDVTRVFEESIKGFVRFAFSPFITFTATQEEDD